MPRLTVKELKLQVDEGFTRVHSRIDGLIQGKINDFEKRIDALQKQGGLAVSEPSDLIKQVKTLELLLSEVITRIENLDNKQPWWKFEWVKTKINKVRNR